MTNSTNPITNDPQTEEKKLFDIPKSILSDNDKPTIVILTPELNDPMFADFWRFNFDELACKFAEFGIIAISAPWMTTPLSCNSTNKFIYIANLAWGYHYRPDQWDTWLHNWPKEIKLINSPSLLQWNTRKTYLQDLQKADVQIIPTLYIESFDEKVLINAAKHFGVSDLIVKPQVSACSFNIVRVLVDSNDFASAPRSMSPSEAVAELTRLDAAHSPMMIQPFMSSVVQEGEISVFVFDGKVSHAVRSNTQPDDYRVQFEHGGVTTAQKELSYEMIELVHQALAVCPETPVYARVDMIRNNIIGKFCVIEVELIEPNLFLQYAPDGGTAFVHAILRVSGLNSP
ncbi:hypothetical protein I4U23_019979 [Adineta vaga]|nr:hypothetical protein I4U23_019979 [Adineta vaga]